MKLLSKTWIANLALLVMTISTIPVQAVSAADLSVKPDRVHYAFNKVANEVGVNNRMQLTTCENAVCGYSLTGKLGAVANSTSVLNNNLKEFILVFGKGSDGNSMIVSMGLLMMVFSPDVSAEERTSAINVMADAIVDGSSESADTNLAGVNYRISKLGSAGVWFSVKGK